MYKKRFKEEKISTYNTKNKVNCINPIVCRSSLTQVINGKTEGETEVNAGGGRRSRQTLGEIEVV